MDRKYQTVLIVAIAVTVFAAVFVGFGLPALVEIPKVTLPDISQESIEETDFLPVTVTPETVQEVIATLSRPESYYGESQVKLSWSSGNQGASSAYLVQIWSDGGYVKTKLRPSGGSIEHRLVADGKLYIWYEGDRRWREMDAPDGSADLAQRLPTYEDVLRLDPADITDAGYQSKDGTDCIYVQVHQKEINTLDCYWIETATGLLCGAETWEGETLVYEMKQTGLQTPLPQGVDFALPDGRVLHSSAAVGE